MNNAKQKTIYLIRHGQSVANASPVFQGDDSPLSEQGEAQAMAVANRMSHVPFDTLIASTFKRAAQTAQHIADKTQKDIVLSDLFVELKKPTALHGRPYTDTAANELWRLWKDSLQTVGQKVADGESYDEFLARADMALAYLLERPESTIAVVTHGGFLRAMLARVLYGDAITPSLLQRFHEHLSIENTGITVLQYKDAFEEEPSWRIWTVNDHSHFAE
jgi:probable phosphoglycerate mutase